MIEFYPFSKFYKYKLNVTNDEKNQVKIIMKDKFTTYNQLNILNVPTLKDLRKQITDILDKHGLLLNNNFAQRYNKLDYHGVHIHPNSRYSGILYLSSEGTPTVFYDQWFESYEQPVEENTLLLFPSYIPHEVRFLTEDEDRLVISFNTDMNPSFRASVDQHKD